jgi:hypothetical protein
VVFGCDSALFVQKNRRCKNIKKVNAMEFVLKKDYGEILAFEIDSKSEIVS